MAEAKDKRIFLIDGHALVFKMYYALLRRPMVNSKGVDTSILYGFTKYLLELIDRQKPEYLAVAFDPPGGSFRNKLYPAYKANRDATPQLVIDALDPLCEICRAMDIPVLMIPGFEADEGNEGGSVIECPKTIDEFSKVASEALKQILLLM